MVQTTGDTQHISTTYNIPNTTPIAILYCQIGYLADWPEFFLPLCRYIYHGLKIATTTQNKVFL
jgi:hypothetical protein